MSDTSPDPEQLDPFSRAEQTLPRELYDAIITLLGIMSSSELLEEVQRDPILLTQELAAAVDNLLESARQINQMNDVKALQPRYDVLKQILEPAKEELGTLPYDLANLLRGWMSLGIDSLDESQAMLEANAQLLLSDKALETLEFLLSFGEAEKDEEDESPIKTLLLHRSILINARDQSIDVAYTRIKNPSPLERALLTIPQNLINPILAFIKAKSTSEVIEQIKQYPVLLTSEAATAIDKLLDVLQKSGKEGEALLDYYEVLYTTLKEFKTRVDSNRVIFDPFLEADTPAKLQQVILQNPTLFEEKTVNALAATIIEIEQRGDPVSAQMLRLRLQELQRIRQLREKASRDPDLALSDSDKYERIEIHAERGGIAANVIYGNIYQIENYTPPVKQWQPPPRQRLRKAFIGRQDDLDRLLKYLIASDDASTDTPTAAVIQGMGGIGKTYMARKVANELYDHFSGRVIWIDVGANVRVEESLQVRLGRLAKYAFGGEVPVGQLYPEQVAMWLEEMAPGRLLVIFDDVWDQETLRLLDAALPASAVRLITTRHAVVARTIEGKVIHLDRLTPQDGLALLQNRLRSQGSTAYQAELELVRLLDGHALALDIVAARIQTPTRVHAVLNDLKNGIGLGKLDGLKLSPGEQKDDNVVKSFALTYDQMAEEQEQQRRFRALGVFAPETPITSEAAAAIWGINDLKAAQIALFSLTDLALLIEIEEPTGITYLQHHLLQVYAHALLDQEGELASASWAHAKYYTDLTRRAESAVPKDYSLLDRHIQNLLSALAWAVDNEPVLFSELLEGSDQFLQMRGQSALLEVYLPKAIDIAAMMENRVRQANSLLQLGLVKRFQGNPDQVRAHFEAAKTLFHNERFKLGEANVLKSLGDLELHLGNLGQAQAHYDLAWPIFRTEGSRMSEASLLVSLGKLESQLGDLEQARAHYDTALSISRETHDRLLEANALISLGTIEAHLGNIDQARAHFDSASPLVRGEHPRGNEAVLLESLGTLEMQLGNFDQARADYEAALLLIHAERMPFAEAALHGDLGDLERYLGNFDQARIHYEAALPLMRAERTLDGEADVLRRLGDLGYRLGRLDDARTYYDAALILFQKVRSQLGEANVLKGLGNLDYRQGKIDDARTHYDAALPLYQHLRDRLGEANVRRRLGDLERHLDRLDEARVQYDAALSLYRLDQARLGEANTLAILGDLQQQLGKLDEARAYYDTALPLFQQLYNRLGEANLHQSLGNLEYRLEKYDEARAHYESALSLYQETHHELGRAYIYVSIGELLRFQKQLKQAQSYYEQALPLFVVEQDPIGQARTLFDLGIVRFELGDHEQGVQDVQQAIILFRLVQDENGALDAEMALIEMHTQLAQQEVNEEEQSSRNRLRIVQVSDEDLERGDISNLKSFFDQVIIEPKHAKLLRGKVAITFPKYDNDPRESFQIDEIRQFIQYLDAEFPYFLYFLDSSPGGEIFLWFACLLPLTEVQQQEGRVAIGIDPEALTLLLVVRILAIDTFCKKILDDSKPIIEGILMTQPEQVATCVATLLSSDNP